MTRQTGTIRELSHGKHGVVDADYALADESPGEALENLRAFFAILREWDEEERWETARTAHSREERAARTIAEHFRKGVES